MLSRRRSRDDRRVSSDSRPQSLPPCDIEIVISADSGLDISPVCSTKLDVYDDDVYHDDDDDVASNRDRKDAQETPEPPRVTPSDFILDSNASLPDRIAGVNAAFEWVRAELTAMKLKDKEIARTMIGMRSRIRETSAEWKSARDRGYDSGDAENSPSATAGSKLQVSEQEFIRQQWKLITCEGAFVGGGEDFENNKRATWLI